MRIVPVPSGIILVEAGRVTMSATVYNSPLRRVMFASFFALIACGMTFYVILCLGIMASLVLRGWNPANSTVLQSALTRVAIPVSLLAAGVAFVFTLRRPTAS